MKKTLFLLLFFLCFSSFTKADSLDYWQVYYYSILNKIEVETFDISDSEREIAIKITNFDNLNIAFDYLTVDYHSNSPCVECERYIFVENVREQVITKGEAIGKSTPIKIRMADIVKYYRSTKNKYYDFFYIKKNPYGKVVKLLLFRLKVE
ncbi:hypothetical protein [Bernardetia sp. MNP-M8]|uniref:hypothetical protein n=1 Tax=Bernardetia sp. MNP-M8 TaxID=3127470 RepID=UPI0030D228BD